jgi:hypothetical protein
LSRWIHGAVDHASRSVARADAARAHPAAAATAALSRVGLFNCPFAQALTARIPLFSDGLAPLAPSFAASAPETGYRAIEYP